MRGRPWVDLSEDELRLYVVLAERERRGLLRKIKRLERELEKFRSAIAALPPVAPQQSGPAEWIKKANARSRQKALGLKD